MTTMICHTCGQKAVIRMRQHRLALCKDHYLEWIIDQTQRFIEKYDMFNHREKVLVAVSGGKDSLALWDVLWRLGYQTAGMYIHLGIAREKEYSTLSEQYARDFAAERDLPLHMVNVQEESGLTIPELAQVSRRGRSKPCAVCGLVKRHTMNRTARELGFEVLATGHNLDDEAAFLFGNLLSWNIRQLHRQSPYLPEKDGFARKVKPFCRFTERETAAYALLRGIDYIEDECPYAVGSKQIEYKNLLNQLEEVQPGAKLRFMLGFLQVREDGFFPPEEITEENLDLQPCPSCGQPTTSGGLCSLCRLLENARPIE
jgi:uncharacterized protein (TIGR00269 family)